MRNQGLAKWIFVGNLLMSAGLLSVSATAFTRQPPAILSVERLNIVDAVGHVLLALAARMLVTAPGPVRGSLNRERMRVRARIEGTPRLIVGSEDRVAKVELRDLAGRVRLRLLVDSGGVGRLVFLDSTGNQTTI